MLAIFFKPKINIKLPSPGVWTGNGQGHKVVKSSQKLQERERERESSWMKIAGFWVPKVHFSGLERPLWQTGVMSPEGEPTYTSHNEGEAGILGPHGEHVGHCPSRRMLGLTETILMLKTISRGKKRIWSTHKNMSMYYLQQNFPKSPESECLEWSTAKIKFVPQGQSNRPLQEEHCKK